MRNMRTLRFMYFPLSIWDYMSWGYWVRGYWIRYACLICMYETKVKSHRRRKSKTMNFNLYFNKNKLPESESSPHNDTISHSEEKTVRARLGRDRHWWHYLKFSLHWSRQNVLISLPSAKWKYDKLIQILETIFPFDTFPQKYKLKQHSWIFV
jgi:hypothetical protein